MKNKRKLKLGGGAFYLEIERSEKFSIINLELLDSPLMFKEEVVNDLERIWYSLLSSKYKPSQSYIVDKFRGKCSFGKNFIGIKVPTSELKFWLRLLWSYFSNKRNTIEQYEEVEEMEK